MNHRHFNAWFLIVWVCVWSGIMLVGCSGLDDREQKTVSGAAIGGTVACWPGAAIGAGIGYLVGHADE